MRVKGRILPHPKSLVETVSKQRFFEGSGELYVHTPVDKHYRHPGAEAISTYRAKDFQSDSGRIKLFTR